MITKNFLFKNFQVKKNNKSLRKYFKQLIVSKNEIIKSLTSNYYYSYTKQKLVKFQKCKDIRIFGMGGSSLGANAIYDFLKYKIKKNFYFLSNLQKRKFSTKKNYLNLIISKSGNTLETIVNSNIYISKKDQNIVITENKTSYLRDMGIKLKSEIIDHNNFIGGRYSVLSEVGMLPAELMGLNEKKFKQFNNIIKNKKFINSLIKNVSNIIFYIKKKKFNSIIINYDPKSENLFKWYQQLVAESLGKKKKGILPVISNMPKDNHSVMQLYLDGFQNNFYTFFHVNEKNLNNINNNKILTSQKFLKNQNLSNIIFSQKKATENVFKKKKIPFRSFEIYKRNEKTLGELFCFFMLETILIGKCLKIDPFDQPAVELIKKETKKLLI